MTASNPLLLESRQGIATVTLNRPQVRNAFDAALVAELCAAFEKLGGDTSVRGVVLAGAGPVFCAGMDLGWMARSDSASERQRLQDAEQLQQMFQAIDACPWPVVGRVQGAAYGGGVGLVAACDVVVAAEDARFALREVRVGLLPAVIAPWLLDKIGYSQARRYCLTGEPFSAQVGQSIGLVHDVVPADQLDRAILDVTGRLRQGGPQALRETKGLLRQLLPRSDQDRRRLAAQANARVRATEEAREGLRAFVEKRPPVWAKEEAGG